MASLLDPNLTKAFQLDQKWLSETALPIVTVSGTFREDAKGFHHLPDNNFTPDIVLSRAHFSMALGVAIEAWGGTTGQMDYHKAWVADPTNYVSAKQWANVRFTEFVGKTLARYSILKTLKDFADKFGRNNLPIAAGITPPLLYLTEHVTKPILSFHIAAGNILAGQGRQVIQIVTDPHVRPEYVMYADKPNITYCVFDEETKLEFLEVASMSKIAVHPEKITVTGPPIDPRVVAARQKKVAWRNGPLKLCITTGGLGTNKSELRHILQQLLPELRRRPATLQLLMYAGTQKDIADMVRQLAKEQHIAVGRPDDLHAEFRLLYHPQILDANELLIHYGFPWADGFITKPSGDMAYDAVAAGCFLLTLKEWGVWEEQIREIFEQKDIARRADTEHIVGQLKLLRSANSGTGGMSWIERAMNRSFGIEKLFLQGSQKIIKTAEHTPRV